MVTTCFVSFQITMNNTTEVQSHVFMRYSSVSALIEAFAPVGSSAERVVPPVWYVIGLFCNPICAVIWLGRRMRRNNSSAVYLGALSISDLTFLFLHFLYNLNGAWGLRVHNTESGCEVFNLFFYVPQYLSTLLVMGFTVERYVAVCHPFMKEKWCTVKKACFIVVALTFFCVLLASAQTYIWDYQPMTDSCSYREEAADGDDKSFASIWNWVTELLVFGAVPLIVLIFNSIVLKEICKLAKNGVVSKQSGSASTTASTVTLLSVSFYLIVTQLTATILFCIQPAFPHGDIFLTDDEIRNDPLWSKMFNYLEARKVIEVICLSHYACYFFIYLLTGKHFRKEVLYYLSCGGRFRCLAKSSSSRKRGEKYSMVSGNGHVMSETCTTTYTTYTTGVWSVRCGGPISSQQMNIKGCIQHILPEFDLFAVEDLFHHSKWTSRDLHNIYYRSLIYSLWKTCFITANEHQGMYTTYTTGVWSIRCGGPISSQQMNIKGFTQRSVIVM